jgi:hypothetical protein
MKGRMMIALLGGGISVFAGILTVLLLAGDPGFKWGEYLILAGAGCLAPLVFALIFGVVFIQALRNYLNQLKDKIGSLQQELNQYQVTEED